MTDWDDVTAQIYVAIPLTACIVLGMAALLYYWWSVKHPLPDEGEDNQLVCGLRHKDCSDDSPEPSAQAPEGGVPMNSQETAQMVEAIVQRAQARILGVGAEQYSDPEGQRWECYPLDVLLAETQDELLDVINYTCFLYARLERRKAVFNNQAEKHKK